MSSNGKKHFKKRENKKIKEKIKKYEERERKRKRENVTKQLERKNLMGIIQNVLK